MGEKGSDEELGEEHVEVGENVEKADLRRRAVELILKKNDLRGKKNKKRIGGTLMDPNPLLSTSIANR